MSRELLEALQSLAEKRGYRDPATIYRTYKVPYWVDTLGVCWAD